MGVDSVLLSLLIKNVAVPELLKWLAERGAAPLTDADVKAKLATDTQVGEDLGMAWFAAHPDKARALLGA